MPAAAQRWLADCHQPGPKWCSKTSFRELFRTDTLYSCQCLASFISASRIAFPAKPCLLLKAVP